MAYLVGKEVISRRGKGKKVRSSWFGVRSIEGKKFGSPTSKTVAWSFLFGEVFTPNSELRTHYEIGPVYEDRYSVMPDLRSLPRA
jgi:hypothetical protein